jgi:acyl carrier protein
MVSVRDEVIELIFQVTRPNEPDLTNEGKPLTQLGLDSLDYSSLLMALEDKFKFQVAEQDVEHLASVQQIVTFVENRLRRRAQ